MLMHEMPGFERSLVLYLSNKKLANSKSSQSALPNLYYLDILYTRSNLLYRIDVEQFLVVDHLLLTTVNEKLF